MFPVEPTESLACAKVNDCIHWLMDKENSFHGYILFEFILSLHLFDGFNEHSFFK